MQQSYRLRKNKQYQYVYHRGRSCACREIVLLYARSSKLQVGFSVSRKVGNSVVRNRVKRRMREQFRALIPQLKRGFYVVVARESAAKADSRALGAALLSAVRRQKLLLGENAGQQP